MVEALKELFWVTVTLNVDLCLKHVLSGDNPADAPSRRVSDLDCSLAPLVWNLVQWVFGEGAGHTCDLMALDSNSQYDLHGNQLPHFAPESTPNALAANMFSQNISAGESQLFSRLYVFAPFPLIGPFLRFLCKQKARCTVAIPDRYLRLYWWPIFLDW